MFRSFDYITDIRMIRYSQQERLCEVLLDFLMLVEVGNGYMNSEQEYGIICMEEQQAVMSAISKISDPQKAAFVILRSAMKVYQADWCGILDVDLISNTYQPYWWIEEGKGEMAPTLFQNLELNEFYERWVASLKTMEPIVVADRNKDAGVMLDERNCYRRLEAYSVIGCPFRSNGATGFIVIRNARRFATEPSYLSGLGYLITSKISEQKALDSLGMRTEAQEIIADNEVRINIFGEIKIQTKGYQLLESELNSTGSWNILVYLLMHRNRGCTTQELCKVDPNAEFIEDKKKSVRQKINRFNQKFKLISSYDLIVREDTQSKEARFRINPELKVVVDMEIYDELIRQYHRTSSSRTRLGLIKKALNIYEGTAYSSHDYEDWFRNTAAYYRDINLKYFEVLSASMSRKRRYRELLQYSMMIRRSMPDEIEGYYWMYYCLKKMRKEKEAQRVMEEAVARFDLEEWEELEEQLGHM